MPNGTINQNNSPEWLSETIKQFIQSAVVSGDMALPVHYPLIHQLDNFQIGFRQHGISGDSLLSEVLGAWQPNWYVIARNGFDDPFFIAIDEQQQGFPVYYAPIGAGRWDAVQVAPSIARFEQILLALGMLADDDTAAAQYIEAETDSSNKLWQEVLEGRLSRQQQLAEEIEAAHVKMPVNADDYKLGELILTDAGPQKLKVAQYIVQILGVSPQQALALIAKGEVTVSEGNLISLRSQKSKLITLGASVIFRQSS